MKVRTPAIIALAASALLFAAQSLASGAQVRVPGGAYTIKLTSLKEARFKTTVRQQYDFSCGSAATATLLTYQYDFHVSEADVFAQMYASGDKKRIQREGFSLLDMQRYLHAHGFDADGFELPLDKLFEEGLPAIVLLNDKGYRHFVVVKGMRNGRVLVGDPARGTRALPRERFDALWDNGVLFVVHNRRALAQFNQSRDWRIAPPAPLASGLQQQNLQNIVMRRRGAGDI